MEVSKTSTTAPNRIIQKLTKISIVAGTSSGHGYAQDISEQSTVVNNEFAWAYYRGARQYNSGMIDSSGDLGKGGATHCYASDIANRLTGWTDSQSGCTLDSSNSTRT